MLGRFYLSTVRLCLASIPSVVTDRIALQGPGFCGVGLLLLCKTSIAVCSCSASLRLDREFLPSRDGIPRSSGISGRTRESQSERPTTAVDSLPELQRLGVSA